MNLLARETSHLPAWERSKRSRNIIMIGAVALFFGILELFAFSVVANGPGFTTCPAGGCGVRHRGPEDGGDAQGAAPALREGVARKRVIAELRRGSGYILLPEQYYAGEKICSTK